MDLSLEGMREYARQFAEKLPALRPAQGQSALVIGLRGGLGAGKTTFVQAVAKELGVTESVTSPTYVIVQSYPTTHPIFKKLVHVDAYRLASGEPDTIGFAAAISDPANIILVEWPENLPKILYHELVEWPIIHFETIDEHTRRISLKV